MHRLKKFEGLIDPMSGFVVGVGWGGGVCCICCTFDSFLAMTLGTAIS